MRASQEVSRGLCVIKRSLPHLGRRMSGVVVGRINIQYMQGGHVGCGQQDSGTFSPPGAGLSTNWTNEAQADPWAPRALTPVLRGSWLADCASEVPLWYLFPATRPPRCDPVLAPRPLNAADGA